MAENVRVLREKAKNKALTDLSTYKKFCIIRPTGFGKTGMLTAISKNSKKYCTYIRHL